ncbi:hypothetical protein Nepgr_005370 [Nepenthes gracilis]|uniref:Uncharacterized protein n=1 Tax=Nepenthes gracilis TaxID=150966 RepID=A0AAD3S3E6_NEPGR|nr:hypothetical protein Nepgr_005370 [Nepenthes gracilis]
MLMLRLSISMECSIVDRMLIVVTKNMKALDNLTAADIILPVSSAIGCGRLLDGESEWPPTFDLVEFGAGLKFQALYSSSLPAAGLSAPYSWVRSVPDDSSAGVDSGADLHFSPDEGFPTGSFMKGSSMEACNDAPSNTVSPTDHPSLVVAASCGNELVAGSLPRPLAILDVKNPVLIHAVGVTDESCEVASAFCRVSLPDWILLLGGAMLLLSTICSTGFFGHVASADAWSAGVGFGLEPVMLVWAGIDDGRWAVILLLKQSSCCPWLVACFLFYGAGFCLSCCCWVADCRLLAVVVQKCKVISMILLWS